MVNVLSSVISFKVMLNLWCHWKLVIEIKIKRQNLNHCSLSQLICMKVPYMQVLLERTWEDLGWSNLPTPKPIRHIWLDSYPSGNKTLISTARWILWQKPEVKVTAITCQYCLLPQGNGGNMARVWAISGKEVIWSDCTWFICFRKGQNTKVVLKLTVTKNHFFILNLSYYIFKYFITYF